jgi:hypothetical protein
LPIAALGGGQFVGRGQRNRHTGLSSRQGFPRCARPRRARRHRPAARRRPAQALFGSGIDHRGQAGEFERAGRVGLGQAVAVDRKLARRAVEAQFAALEAGQAARCHRHQQEHQNQRGKGHGGQAGELEQPVAGVAAGEPGGHARPALRARSAAAERDVSMVGSLIGFAVALHHAQGDEVERQGDRNSTMPRAKAESVAG